MRKLALLSLDYIRPKDPSMPLGVASIIANLKKHSIEHQSFFYNVRYDVDPEQIVDDIMRTNSTDVLIGAFVWNEPYVQYVMKKIYPYKRIVIGGPQVSYVGSGELEAYYPEAFAFIRGYAEQATVEYAMSNDQFPGTHIAQSQDKCRQASVQLETLPSPLTTNIVNPKNFLRWETQRGCPYQCSFCQHRDATSSGVSRVYKNRLQEEIDWLKGEKKNVKDIAILDPTFNTDTVHATWVLSQLPESKVSLQIRPEKLNRRFLEATTESNADVTLEMGVQTLVPDEMEIINRVKGADPRKVVDKVKEKLLLAEEYKTNKEITLIYGLPRQSIGSFIYTLEWCKTNTTAKVIAFPLMLLRGTPLYYRKDELNLVEGVRHFTDQYRISDNIPHVISTPTMTETDWWKMGKFSEL
jgi:radical SAM superfamily enzyme YgiQ (UPF0313 family)